MNRMTSLLGVLGLGALWLLPGAASAGDDEGEGKRIRYVVIEVQDESAKYSYEVVPERAANQWVNSRMKRGEHLRRKGKEMARAERKETPEPERVKARVKKRNLKSKEDAEIYAKKLLAKVPERLRAQELAEGGEKGERERARVKAKEKRAEREE